MKCPYCNNDLQEGSIQSGDEIAWFPNGEKKVILRKSINPSKIAIGKFSYLNGGNALASFCKNCELIIISTKQ